MKLHRGNVVALDRRAEGHAVIAVRRAIRGNRRRVGMREIDLRPLGTPPSTRLPWKVMEFHHMCTFKALRSGGFEVLRCQLKHTPSNAPRPSTSGASSLPSNSHCKPTQIPNNGMPSSTIVLMAVRHQQRGRWWSRSGPRGHDHAVGAAELAGDGWRPHLRTDRGQRFSHRREIAGAVVDQRDHSSPSLLGRSCQALSSSTPSAAPARTP